MNISTATILSLISIIFIVLSAVVLYLYYSSRKKLLRETSQNTRRQYELNILSSVQNAMTHSLTIDSMVDVLTRNLHSLVDYSAVSSLIIQGSSLTLTTRLQETVGPSFISQMKQNMLTSLTSLAKKPFPSFIEEHLTGKAQSSADNRPVGSFFNIPLVWENAVVGILSIASTQKNVYTKEEITMINQVINQASAAVSHMQQIKAQGDMVISAMTEHLKDGILMIDTAKNITLINTTARTLLSLTSSYPSAQNIFDAFGSFEFEKKFDQAVSEKKVIEEKMVKLVDASATITLNPIFSSPQTVWAVLVTIKNTTSEKIMLQQKDDFTHMMVHELRAPMTAVKDASEILIDQSTKFPPEQQRKLLMLIEQQSKRLLDQISDILDAAKIEAGKFTIDKAPTDIAKLIQERVDIFTPEAKNKQIALAADISAGLPAISIDSGRIAQVVNNLLSNSFKFTPAGGKITVKASIDGQCIRVAITDTGAGIPKEQQGRLFSKYVQAGHTNGNGSSKPKGTGLGLFIIKGIIEAHAGSIHLESEVGRGTTIWFLLPIVSNNTQTTSLSPKSASAPQAPPVSTIPSIL